MRAPAPSVSPAMSLSRRASITQYPPLPFSPPIPTLSASSQPQPFVFPPQFIPGANGSGTQSPGIPAVPTPLSMNGKYNPRSSISIPAGELPFTLQALQQQQHQSLPHTFSPQSMLLQEGLHRAGSPSLANLSALMSPTSPFSPDGIPMHQRHQSLQFPSPSRCSCRPAHPRACRTCTGDEKPEARAHPAPEPDQSPATTQRQPAKEIDEAEYHLEEQFRSQLEHDEDYSPHHHENARSEATDASQPPDFGSQTAGPSVQFAPQPLQRFAAENGPELHHPRPHSRGHSLSQKFFTEEEARTTAFDRGFTPGQNPDGRADDAPRSKPNPPATWARLSRLWFGTMLHQRSMSTQSNPWSENGGSASGTGGSRRPSHGSKPSLSKLNVRAPQFKFDPTSSFQPGQFNFSGTRSDTCRLPSRSLGRLGHLQHVELPLLQDQRERLLLLSRP